MSLSNKAERILNNCKIRSDYFEDILAKYDKVVISEPCGTGKTLGVGEFIVQNWEEGVLFVSYTKSSLYEMKNWLEELGIESYRIAIFDNDTKNKTDFRENLKENHVVLVTHTRLLIDQPLAFVAYNYQGRLKQRKFMIVDEALSPSVIMQIPEMYAQGVMSKAGLNLGDTFEKEEADRILKLKLISDLERISKTEFKYHGVRYIDIIGMSDVAEEMRRYAYEMAFFQILTGKFIVENKYTDVLIPLTPYQIWYDWFEKTVVLDATGKYVPFLYERFEIIESDFNFSLIDKLYNYSTDFNLSKTKIRKNKFTFLNNDIPIIRESISEGFNNPYCVTPKEFNDEIVDAFEHKFKFTYYDKTKGSNRFMHCDSALLIGAYRLPVNYGKLAKLVYKEFNVPMFAAATWIQELYRSRIRKGEKINLLYLGDTETIDTFNKIIGRRPVPVISVNSSRDLLNSLLKKELTKGRRVIVNELRKHGYVELRDIAKTYFRGRIRDAKSSARGLLKDYPKSQPWIELDEENEIVRIRETLPNLNSL